MLAVRGDNSIMGLWRVEDYVIVASGIMVGQNIRGDNTLRELRLVVMNQIYVVMYSHIQ